jgi:FAD/FMN-containing dehydrogenase
MASPALPIAKPVEGGTVVNDIHSQLNATCVDSIVAPRDVDHLAATVARAGATGKTVSIAGGRHAMGGQQFAERSILIDMRSLDRVVGFDSERGLVTVEGGIMWPALMAWLEGRACWGIVQKQTGADRLSVGGALSCNAHGRGLTLKPIVDQIESFEICDSTGSIKTCSREQNSDLFRLAIGGYGLFGVLTRVQLRLCPRTKVQRVVALGDTSDLMDCFAERIRDGYLYGDFQFATDEAGDSFLRRGVFSCYRPVDLRTPLTEDPVRFSPDEWATLTRYSHSDKPRAFAVYSRRYLETSGQIYWADAQLSAAYVDDYHAELDRATGAAVKGAEMITEIYVPRRHFTSFMHDARAVLRDHRANVIYGTVRLIEKDDETFLAWAKDRYACIVFNLHVDHTPRDLARAADAFRALIDVGISLQGSYYLTYHRWARRDQVEHCYPQLAAFLSLKRRHDPGEVFQSDWYRHHKTMFSPDAFGPQANVENTMAAGS